MVTSQYPCQQSLLENSGKQTSVRDMDVVIEQTSARNLDVVTVTVM